MSLFAGSQSNSDRSSRLKILVVDDDLLSQHLMRILLTREGYQIETASNGVEAIEKIKHEPFDIVFMDLRMPVMDGIETSRRIREWEDGRQHTCIVALTAGYFADEARGLAEAGIDNYIPKPFQVEHIQRVLQERLDARTLPSFRGLPPGAAGF